MHSASARAARSPAPRAGDPRVDPDVDANVDPHIDPRLEAALRASRLVIERLRPQVNEGAYPARAVAGQPLAVECDAYADGHEALRAEVEWHAPDAAAQRMPMQSLGNDRWRALLHPQATGLHRYRVRAWIDVWGSYRQRLQRLLDAGAARSGDIAEGIAQVRACLAATQTHDADHEWLEAQVARHPAPAPAHARWLLDARCTRALEAFLPRAFETCSEMRDVRVERTRAGFASWYELFPRSCGERGRHGTFDDVIGRLPAIAAMGFDVLYMPPIHPIGRTHRKGRNNALSAAPGDPGSPYAIGDADGGHTAVHAQLGGIEGFRRLRDAAAGYGMELALDFAIQCSPDHPWLREHPEWFAWRADGSVRCAENPPKRYEDIVNVEFYAPGAMPSLWLALRDVIEFWVGEGVRSFRVDNPHTKPLPFWEWLIADVKSRHPDVLFLSEAFTRPAMMYRLAKIGFSQSYTYFTWRNHKDELARYVEELAQGEVRDFFRPHFFVNTPDINPRFLHDAGRPGFLIRAALATTLSGLWGMYSGFEICESAALPGREEYLDSEKYQLRHRDWSAHGNIVAEIGRLNHLRREHAALQTHLGSRIVASENPRVLVYSRMTPGADHLILVAVSLDPHAPQETWMDLPRAHLDLPADAPLRAVELMSQRSFEWTQPRQHWRLMPQEMPFAIWHLSAARVPA